MAWQGQGQKTASLSLLVLPRTSRASLQRIAPMSPSFPRPLREGPLLGLGRLLVVQIRPASPGGHEHAGAGAHGGVRPVRRAVPSPSVGVLAGARPLREVLAESILSILRAEVVASPESCADPDACNTDDHYDNEDDPLPVG